MVACQALAQVGMGKYQYHVRGDVLMRGRYDEALQALQAPKLVDPATPWPDMIQTVHQMANVGASGVCFDLAGFSEDGTAIADEALDRFDKTMEQLIWRRMQTICKVFGEGAPQDAAWRKTAVETAAKAMGSRPEAVYWIDGPEAATLARAFKRLAPSCVVAAPENGDILAVTELPATMPDGPVLLVGKVPEPYTLESHFVLPAGDESYRAFEAVTAFPKEKQPWTPDNSVLSEEERQEGFVSLFDGKTLNGWVITGENKEGFVVRDGAIVWNARGGQQLRTVKRYDNYVLRLEWAIGEGKNNGLQLRCPRAGRNSKVGFEFQMLGQQFDTPNNDSTASIYDVLPPLKDTSKPAGEWNTLEITLDGPHYKAVLNGEVVQDVNFDEVEELRYRLRNGFIVISDHGGYAAFRNIRLKPL